MADVRNYAMLALAGERCCRRFPIRGRHDTIRVAFQRDRRHCDGRWRDEPLLEILVRSEARRKAKAMPVRMDDDLDVVGVSKASALRAKVASRILKGIGHDLPQEAPRAFADAIVEADGY